MRFFTDPTPFTHRVRFYGFPAYANLEEADCPLSGTNVVWDWCIAHIAPEIHALCELVRWVSLGADYEPSGWRIEIVRPLNK